MKFRTRAIAKNSISAVPKHASKDIRPVSIKRSLLGRAPENHNPRMKTTSLPITSFSGECPVTAFP